MTDFKGFRGAARRLDDEDLPRIGAQIGVGEDELHAVLDVEAAGSGFDAEGRPKMLFEPHIFYRNLVAGDRDRAVREGLAYEKWKHSYPAESYTRMAAALAINEDAALRSSSWGRMQVMGFNHASAGYDTPAEMVLALMDDEEAGVQAGINFIKSRNLDRYLRTHQWDKFALGYNGEGYKQNGYDTKLASRFAFWKGKPDTPWTPPGVVSPVPAPTLSDRVADLEALRDRLYLQFPVLKGE